MDELFIVINDKGYAVEMCMSEQEALEWIDKFGKHMFGVAPVGLGTSEYFERKKK